MIKKTLMLITSAAALMSFGIPSIAQADTLTENGQSLAAGAKITATGTLHIVSGSGTIKCNATLHLELISNRPATIQQLGAATTSGCKANGILPVTITDGTVGHFTIEEGTGLTSATFASHVYADAAHINLLQTCDYANVGTMDITATDGTDVIHVAGKVTATACTEGTMTGSFTLETSGGTPIVIDVE
jgi:hypothetical protein